MQVLGESVHPSTVRRQVQVACRLHACMMQATCQAHVQKAPRLHHLPVNPSSTHSTITCSSCATRTCTLHVVLQVWRTRTT